MTLIEYSDESCQKGVKDNVNWYIHCILVMIKIMVIVIII